MPQMSFAPRGVVVSARGGRVSRVLRAITPEDCETLHHQNTSSKDLSRAANHCGTIGQPGAGKSVLAPHLAYAVAQGRPVLGRRVRQGPVLYLAAEDGYGMTMRVRAMRKQWGDAPDFYLARDTIDLLSNTVDLQLGRGLIAASR